MQNQVSDLWKSRNSGIARRGKGHSRERERNTKARGWVGDGKR